ncbi:Cupin 2 conserved barrel [Penicillium taxi]|uniref:Cupin 2 conserved barrel n=1 Tax=Penicillium taxi TaxID=168475 RepID=UPI00254559EF|nr:Cupin 2 conserved barrel [Penicillium taxi]KAJ5902688.1 Cupin 2 conserved barrel [Penicillium taxi]
MSNTGQISPLRPVTRHITGHDAEGNAIIQSSTPCHWKTYEKSQVAFDLIYTTSGFPVDLNADADITAHENIVKADKLGLVNPRGTVCRIVDFPPANEPLIHRTKSLDYGVVLEGEVEMVVEEGEPVLMKRGDVAVQRATMHGWRNPSQTEWCRMLFVLQDCALLTVNGKEMNEDLGSGAGDLEPSGNDV